MKAKTTDDKVLLLLVGKSGSGKNYFVDMIGLSKVIAYTTRPPRPGEIDKVHYNFVDNDYLNSVDPKQVIAPTLFHGHTYFTLLDQLENNQAYILDSNGLSFFNEKMKGKLNFKSALVISPWYRRLYRLIKRDGLIQAVKRLNHDRKEFKGVRTDFIIKMFSRYGWNSYRNWHRNFK